MSVVRRTPAAAVALLLAAALLVLIPAAGPARAAECDPAATPEAIGRSTVVVLVHGIGSSAEIWSAGSPALLDTLRAVPGAYVAAFDYAPAADRWVTDDGIGPALARHIACLADASRAGGGSGRLLLVGESTGGLAIRCALAEACGGVAGNDQRAGAVVTVGTPNNGMLLQPGATPESSVVPDTPLWGLCQAVAGAADPDPAVDGACSSLRAVVESHTAAALLPGSAELAALPPYPPGVPVRAIAGNARLDLALFDLPVTSTAPASDLLVAVDSALAGGTEPDPTVADCGRWAAVAGPPVGLRPGGCRGGALVGSPAVDESVRKLVSDYVARNRCGVDLTAPAITDVIAQVPLDYPDYAWEPGSFTGNYDPCAALSGVELRIQGSTAGSPMQVMLFSYGRFIGTGTGEAYSTSLVDVDASTRDTVVVNYVYPRPWDSGTAGASGYATVRYQWDGAKVVMLDELPPDLVDPPDYPTISLAGFGPFQWGDTQAAAEQALGLNAFALSDLGGGCAQAELPGVLDTTFGISDGVVFAASVSGNMVVTDTGVRIGDPVGKLSAAYPGITAGPGSGDALSTRYEYTSGGRTASFISYDGTTVDWMTFGLQGTVNDTPCV